MSKATLLRGAGLSLAHFLLIFGLVIYAFGKSMAHFDSGNLPQGIDALIENTVDLVGTILMNPGMLVYTLIPSDLKTDPLEWSITILNSVLWGFGLLFLWRRVKSRTISA